MLSTETQYNAQNSYFRKSTKTESRFLYKIVETPAAGGRRGRGKGLCLHFEETLRYRILALLSRRL